VALSTLDEWACTVKTMVDNRIRKLKDQPQKTRKRQILKTNIWRNCMRSTYWYLQIREAIM
jgi:hypothetical protein